MEKQPGHGKGFAVARTGGISGELTPSAGLWSIKT